MALDKLRLDAMAKSGCQDPACKDHGPLEDVFFHAICHPSAPTWARYTPASGTITIECAACHKTVVEVLVGLK